MEKRKEFSEGDTITCPQCGSEDLDYSKPPTLGRCQSCQLEFEVKTVLVWDEPEVPALSVHL